jgi:integrase/recombinase XerD
LGTFSRCARSVSRVRPAGEIHRHLSPECAAFGLTCGIVRCGLAPFGRADFVTQRSERRGSRRPPRLVASLVCRQWPGRRRASTPQPPRHLEALGRARATIARRLCTMSCFYRYAEQEGLIAVSPAAHVRRPRLDYESHATGLDRNEVGAMLVAAGLATARDHALISVLALNGLRVSEAIGADIEDLGLERGHRTLTIVRKGGKVVTVPLAPRSARAIDLAVAERAGPIFVTASGERIDRHAAGRIVRRTARRAGIAKRVGPHTLRHAFITAALDAGVLLRGVQDAASHADPRTTMRYDRARVSLDRHATCIVATFLAGASR